MHYNVVVYGSLTMSTSCCLPFWFYCMVARRRISCWLHLIFYFCAVFFSHFWLLAPVLIFTHKMQFVANLRCQGAHGLHAKATCGYRKFKQFLWMVLFYFNIVSFCILNRMTMTRSLDFDTQVIVHKNCAKKYSIFFPLHSEVRSFRSSSFCTYFDRSSERIALFKWLSTGREWQKY